MKQNLQHFAGPLKATFSIVAADPASGQVGVAVQSKYFAVGAVVPWARAGVGAVATQAVRRLARYGPELLAALEAGARPQEAFTAALASDPLAAHRQIGVVHADGEGSQSHRRRVPGMGGRARTGPSFSVQGNILAGEGGGRGHGGGLPIHRRQPGGAPAGLAGGGAGRRRRSTGQQSAALVVEQTGYREIGVEGIDRLVDLRVDDHPEPIRELRRLYGLWQIEDLTSRPCGTTTQATIRSCRGDPGAGRPPAPRYRQHPVQPGVLRVPGRSPGREPG